MEFSRGITTEKLRIGDSDTTGTKITFIPDEQVFTDKEFKFDLLAKRLRNWLS